jgi:hypothetical protein
MTGPVFPQGRLPSPHSQRRKGMGQGIAVREHGTLLLSTLLLLSAACSSGAGDGSGTAAGATAKATPPVVTVTPSQEPEPAKPKSPKLARLDGTYKVTFILVHSTLPDSPAKDTAQWKFTPKCKSHGGCDATLKSISGHYQVRAPFIKNKYRFSQRVPKAFTCSSGGSVDYYITSVRDATFEISKMKLLDGEWTATRLEGSEDEHGTRGCGFQGSVEQRYVIRAARAN